MKIFKAVFPSAAIAILLIGATGCNSQKHDQTAFSQTDSGSARSMHTSWTPSSISWTGGHTSKVEDPAFGETAFTVGVPAGWKFVGAILRPHTCYGPSIPADGLSYTVLAPDGYTAIGQMPGSSWAWQSDGSNPQGPKCAPIGIDSAAGFLLNIAVPNIHPDATNVAFVPNTPQMQAKLESARAQFAQPGPGGTHRLLDSGRVRVEYKIGDQPMEEMLFAIMDCMVSNMPAYPLLHRPAMTRRSCSIHGTVFRRAPKGHLDALLASNPPAPQISQDWDQHVSERMRAAFAQYQKASDDRFRSIQKHFADVTAGMLERGRQFQDEQQRSFNHAMAADRASQDAIDHASHLQVLDSLNRQDFIDPTTGRKIETSNQYTHNWISSDKNEVVLNDDPTFNPNGVVDPVRQSWTELIPAD